MIPCSRTCHQQICSDNDIMSQQFHSNNNKDDQSV